MGDENAAPNASPGKPPPVRVAPILRRKPFKSQATLDELEIMSKRLQLEERRRTDAELTAGDATAMAKQVKELANVAAEKDKRITDLHARLNKLVAEFADVRMELNDAPSAKDLQLLGGRLKAAENVARTVLEERKGLEDRLIITNRHLERAREELIHSAQKNRVSVLRLKEEAMKADLKTKILENQLQMQRATNEQLVLTANENQRRLEALRSESEKKLEEALLSKVTYGKRLLRMEGKVRAQWSVEDNLREELERLGESIAERDAEQLDLRLDLLNKEAVNSIKARKDQAVLLCTEITYGIIIDAVEFACRS